MKYVKILGLMVFLIYLLVPLAQAANYGSGTYGSGLYGQGETDDTEDATPPTPSGDGGGGAIQSLQFDIKILDFDSALTVGELFNFTYFVKGIGNINNDVTVEFWIEKNGEIITSGSDVIFMGSNEEKTETASLFLPTTIESGIYQLKVRVSFGSIDAESHRTIEFVVDEGIVEVDQLFDISFYLEKILIEHSDDLRAVVLFKNFGTESVLINLTFIILDEGEDEIYRERDSITVEIEEVLRKSFKGLYLDEGKYTLVLETLYNENVFDSLKQDFEKRKPDIYLPPGIILPTDIIIGLSILVGVLALIIRARRGKRIHKKTRKRKTTSKHGKRQTRPRKKRK